MHGRGEQVVRSPWELEALGDKTAATLATNHERLLRSVVAGILPQPQAEGLRRPQAAATEAWILHVHVGDGTGTNDAVGKTLWACVKQEPLAGARHEVRDPPGGLDRKEFRHGARCSHRRTPGGARCNRRRRPGRVAQSHSWRAATAGATTLLRRIRFRPDSAAT